MNYYFKGKARWAKVTGEPKSETFTYKGKTITKPAQWSLDLFMDEPSLKAFKNSDSQLKVRTDKETEMDFVSFHRPLTIKVKDEDIKLNPPEVLNSENEPITDLIGNGSEVTIKVSMFNTRMGTGTRLEAVRVENLIPYESKTQVSEDTPIELPF